jgi:hypothetical protein
MVRAVLGPRFVRSARGKGLSSRDRAWLELVEESLVALRELVEVSRLVQVYRAPLRVARQIPATAYELHASARLVDVVRKLELNVRTRGQRRADLRAHFLSRAFHVEVKAHEDRSGGARRGGVRSVQALWHAALAQTSPSTANLLVLGHVELRGLRRVAERAAPGGPFGAVAWLDLQPRRRRWRGALVHVGGARHPFTPALFEVLRLRFEHP